MARLTAIATTVFAFCALLDLRGFDYLEGYAGDLRRGVYARRNGPLAERARRQIVLVTLSDETFQQLPGPPVPRDYHARVIRDLVRAGAKVIAFDLIFDVPRPQDATLAAAAKAATPKTGGKPAVLWACLFENENSPQQQWVQPVPTLRRASPYEGHILVPQDPERPFVDRIQAAFMDHGRAVPALSVQAALLALGLGDQSLHRVAAGWQAGDFVIPVDGAGYFPILFSGTPDEAFASVPYEQIYKGAVNDEFYRRNHFFRDKIVLIGDTTRSGNDLRPTPLGPLWGVELHAHAIATLLQRSFVHAMPLPVNLLAIGLATLLVCWPAALWHLPRAALVASALLLIYFVFDVWLFVEQATELHLVAPEAAMLLTALGVFVERGLTEEREKIRVRDLLRRYVSPQIATYVMEHPEKCVLGGERVPATVLFSDIRGFTPLAGQLAPEQVIEHLNEYLQVMTDVVFRHDGAVDKYIGDAIMALFGVPVPHPNHARRAVATAIDMQSALRHLQARWREQGLPIIDIGIGINTGEMIVGNIGSQERLDFTVIGDTVNIASRVEGLNKEMETRILITAATYEYVRNEVEARGPLCVSIKGREEAIVVYEILDWREDI